MKKTVTGFFLLALFITFVSLSPAAQKADDIPPDKILENKITGLLKKVQEASDHQKEKGAALFELGRIYYNAKQFQKALDYILKAWAIFDEIGDRYYGCASLSLIGGCYYEKKEYTRALDFHMKSLAIRETLRDNMGISMSYYFIAQCHFNLKEYSNALPYYQKSLRLGMRLKNQSLVVEVVIGIGKTYSKLGNYSQALHYLGIAYKAAKEIKRIPQEREAAREMFSIYAAQGDYKNALHLHQLFHQVDKVLIDQTGKKEVQRLNALYETEKKKGQAELLKKDKEIGELNLSKARITRNISIAGFLLAAIILGLLLKKYIFLFAFWKKKKTIGRFRLMEKIGSGAIGTVYKAHSIVNKSETAAVKVLKDELCADETSKKRFKQEAVIIDKLEHPHIIKIIERGEYKQRLFTAMELLEGKTLETKLKEKGQLPLGQSLHIMEQIAEALVLIHSKNIIHRDLKPANIMLIQNNGDPAFVKLLDFGLAKMEFQTRLTQPGSFIGTIQYISPEQVLNSESSPANDIFSMGVISYRMISGQNPFSGEIVMDVLRKIINMVPQDLNKIMSNVPDLLNLLVKKMMDKDPGQRPSSTVVRNTLRRLKG